jgi:ABC-2 type transport system ATP-binding protein
MSHTQSLGSPPDAAAAEPVVAVERLAKSYADRTVLDGLSFTVSKGEIFGILGANGAGKTTLVEIAQGLRRPDAGSVRLRGLDPVTEPRRVRSVVGSQLQSAALPDRLRVGEALRLFARLAGDVVDWRELMAQWDLTRLERTPFRGLSGGERQRLFLALALVGRPEIVFLDELTQGLDPAARRATWELIERVRSDGTTVVLVSHYMDEVQTLCDRVGVVRRGRMDTIATPDALVEDGPVQLRFSGPTGPIERSGLVEALARIPGVHSVERAGTAYAVTGAGAVAVRVAAELVGRGLLPNDFRTERPTLEDVFVSLTRDEQEGAHR